jgi:alpha-galactosidase
VRLLSGATAVHSDMLMWHKEEKPEVAALQLLNILCSVPQVSVRLEEIPAAHLEMLGFWLRFWRKNRDVLLDGSLAPYSPDLNYPVITAATAQKQLTAVYTPQAIVTITAPVPKEVLIVNASHSNSIVLAVPGNMGTRTILVQDCRGRQVSRETRRLEKGVQQIAIPPSGLLTIQ